jgi:hypothetical protein
MYEVAERFYMELIPQAREIIHGAEEHGQQEAADNVRKVLDDILARPEHQWLEKDRVAGIGSHTADNVGLGREREDPAIGDGPSGDNNSGGTDKPREDDPSPPTPPENNNATEDSNE